MRSLSPIPASDGSARLGSSPLRQSRRLEKPEGFLTPNGVGWAHRTRLSAPRRQGKASLIAPVARSRPTGPSPGLNQQPESATAHVPLMGPPLNATAASAGAGMIDDFRLWGSRRWSRTNAPPKEPRWRTWVARDFNHPNAFLSEGGPLAVVVESFPETPHPPRRCRFSRHRGLRHGRGRRERRG